MTPNQRALVERLSLSPDQWCLASNASVSAKASLRKRGLVEAKVIRNITYWKITGLGLEILREVQAAERKEK